ncbi:MAG: sodium:calcium antiporter [Acidobacteriota bacterium]
MDLTGLHTVPIVGVLAAGLATLAGSARGFTTTAERVGLALGLSPFAVGIVIVAVGTSLPELAASLLASSQGTSEVVSGNVLGANTANLLLVLGCVALASRRGIHLGERYIAIDLNFMVGSAALLTLVAFDGRVSRLEGALLLLAYAAYMGHLLTDGRTPSADAQFDEALATSPHPRARMRDFALLALLAGTIYLGASLTLDALIAMAARLGISTAIASVTILSLGTTLPEMTVSVTAAARGRAEMAVGNILGSCIFNALTVVGAASLVGRIDVPRELMVLPVPAFIGSAMLFYLLTQDRRVSPWEGLLFVLGYLLLHHQDWRKEGRPIERVAPRLGVRLARGPRPRGRTVAKILAG